MVEYTLKLLSGLKQDLETELVSAADDDEVSDLAMIRLVAAPSLVAIEIWDGSRNVGRHTKTGGLGRKAH